MLDPFLHDTLTHEDYVLDASLNDSSTTSLKIIPQKILFLSISILLTLCVCSEVHDLGNE